jgi:hypothetical protein
MLISEKSVEIINKQKPMDKNIVERVKHALSNKGVILEQFYEFDKWLISKDAEALTFSNGDIIMHTKVSASGFYEELVHYGQLKSVRAIANDEKNNLLLEIEAKERLIKNKKAYQITDYEIKVVTNVLNKYKMRLEELK